MSGDAPTLWLQLSAGRGPPECEWVVGRLVPLLIRDLSAHGLTVAEIARTPGEGLDHNSGQCRWRGRAFAT